MMKNIIERFQLSMVLAALFFSSFIAACSGDDDPVTPEVVIPENILTQGMTFSKTGGTQTLNIKSNVEPEVTSSAPEWCKVTAESSASTTVRKYSVMAEANADTSDREARITVKAGGSEMGSFIVRQEATDGLIIDPQSTSFDLPAVGGECSVRLTANGEVKATSDVAWITAAGTRAMEARTLVFVVSANPLGEREGHITFTLGSLTETVTVRQAAGSTGSTGSDAKALAAKIHAGINIGNTMEVPGGETGWGNPQVSKAYIDGLKALGFNAVRIPCAWDSHIVNQSTYEVDAAWLERVSEVVGYCVANDMYAIVNIHWDGGWLEDHILGGFNETINNKQKALWTQIATKLNEYDEHLLFAGCNEPGMNETSASGKFDSPEDIKTIMRYEQTFVNAVRATGGNNATRCLVVQAPGTRISDATAGVYALPKDDAQGCLIVEVHFYEPYNFCLMENDADWGKTFWYWGAANHLSGSQHNPTWGEESHVKEQFQLMKTHFVDKGYPVIIGEYCAMKRTVSENQALHNQSRAYWNEVVTREAKNHGCVPFYWETGGDVNRTTGAAKETYAIKGIMKGAAEGKYPY
ncbi:MAG: cellulase family glycosylhydrolase [Bacteroides sp.]|nr:cellulase family glycosylhydrolase [Bacteroides sp.]